MENDIKLFIQYHRPLEEEYKSLYNVIKDKDYYNFIKLNANSCVSDPFLDSIRYTDNYGINIANKNHSYVDLTAVYQYQKNIQCDIIGNMHYSKYFLNKTNDGLITKEEILDYLKDYDFLIHIACLPGRSVYDIYKDFHGSESIDIAGDAIKKLYPEYQKDFEDVMNDDKSTLYNMMIAHKEDYDAYCKQLFDILFESEKYIKVPDDDFQRKVFGFIGERLLLVQLKHNNKRYNSNINFADNMKEAVKRIK